MANVYVGPNGASFPDIGDLQCVSTTNTTTTHMLGAVKDVLVEQFFRGVVEARPPVINIGDHLPLKPSSSGQITNTSTYKTFIGFTNNANDQRGYRDLTPTKKSETGNYTILDGCGTPIPQSIALSINTNAKGCAPGGVPAAMPAMSQETYGREAFGTEQNLIPMCTQEFVEKRPEEIVAVLRAHFQAVSDHVRYSHELREYRWIISKSRYNITAVAVNTCNGKARLITDGSTIAPFLFNAVPNHWGSAQWVSQMLKHTMLDFRRNITIKIPAQVLEMYKKQIAETVGVVFMGNSSTYTDQLNSFQATVLGQNLVYTDRQTGRKITFEADNNPVYVEVVAEGPAIGSWMFQEMWTTRPNDNPSLPDVPGQFNYRYGVQCQCENTVLAALITVSYGSAFHKEPMPNTPPASIKSIFTGMGGRGEINASMAEVWPATMEFRVLTGLEAEAYVLKPWRDMLTAKGFPCDTFNNMYNTWFGGYAKTGAVYVEDNPRELVNFLIKVPAFDECVEVSTACPDAPTLEDEMEIEPGFRTTDDITVNPPPAPEPPEPEAGTVFVLRGNRTVTAPCTGTKEVNIGLRRKGGLAGTLSVTLTKAAKDDSMSTTVYNAITVESPISFADGEEYETATVTIPAITCSEEEGNNQILIIDVAGDIDEDTFDTISICIKCNEEDCCEDGPCEPAATCASC